MLAYHPCPDALRDAHVNSRPKHTRIATVYTLYSGYSVPLEMHSWNVQWRRYRGMRRNSSFDELRCFFEWQLETHFFIPFCENRESNSWKHSVNGLVHCSHRRCTLSLEFDLCRLLLSHSSTFPESEYVPRYIAVLPHVSHVPFFGLSRTRTSWHL